MRLNKKNKLLLLGFILVLYIAYSFAFSNTYRYYKEYNIKKDLLVTSNIAVTYLPQLQLKEKSLDSLLSKNKLSNNDSFQNELLKNLSLLANKNGLKIIDFKEPISFIENNQTIVNYPFTLQGPYNGSLKLLNSIESRRRFGIIKHLSFVKKKNYKTNAAELFTEIIIQKIK